MYPWLVPGATQAPEAPPPRILTDRGWVTLFPMGVYSNAKGEVQAFPLEALVEALVLAEKQHTLDRVDIRNGQVSVTVPIGTAVGSSVTGEIEVPEDETWYLRNHEILIHQQAALTAGDLICNFRISRFPQSGDVDKVYYNTGDRLTATQAQIAAGDIYDHDQLLVGAYWDGAVEVKVYREVIRDFADPDELGNALRLIGGDKLTLAATVDTAAVAGGAITVDLTVWGLRGKRLVE
ncbi:hypothetical protein ACFLY3_00565 [Chloroflexota bacterium]